MVGVVVALLLLIATATALAQFGETVVVASPTQGQSISGIVTMTGTVDFPDFVKYELFLKSGERMLWAATVYAPVINGNLARLDTRTFPDGAYQLVIRQVRSDSNYTEFLGPTFYIENNLGAPLPYPEVSSGVLYPPLAGALARIKNCSGNNLEFDYHATQGFCSGDNLWIMPKETNSPVCPFVDVLLIPCEYRGTAVGQGEPKGAGYSFVAEAGKIYELTYPGGDRIFIGEVAGDERAVTDTGGLPYNDPARGQPVSGAQDIAQSQPAQSAEAKPAVVVATAAPAQAAPAPATTETVLPESGRGSGSNLPFVVAGTGVILLLVVGGVAAARKRPHHI